MDQFNRPDWEDWLMGMAFYVARRSIDPSTQHGSVLVDPDHRIISVGYNGFCRGVDDTKLPLTRPAKYRFVLHAEINCILNAVKPHNIEECTIYITGHPCLNCLNTIAQFGIRNIVYGPQNSKCVTLEDQEEARKFCNIAHMNMKQFFGDITPIMNSAINVFKNLQESR